MNKDDKKVKPKQAEGYPSADPNVNEQDTNPVPEIKQNTDTATPAVKIAGDSSNGVSIEPDAGVLPAGAKLAVDTSILTKNISEELYKESLAMFSSYDNHELIFTVMPAGQYKVNGELLSVIKGKIPTLFKFVAYHDNDLSDTRGKEKIVGVGPFLPDNTPSCVPDSIDLIKDGTYAVQLKLDPQNYAVLQTDGDRRQYYEQVVVVGSQTDSSTLTREYSRRLNFFFRLCRGFNMVVQGVTKEKMNEMQTSNPVYAGITNLWEGDNPHPYLGYIYHPINWFRQEFERVVRNAPINTNEIEMEADGNHKYESRIGCITDQFTKRALDNSKRRLDENILTPQRFYNMVQAHSHQMAQVRIIENKLPKFAKYFMPTENAWQVTMIRLMLDSGLRNAEINKLVEELVQSKLFSVASSAGFFSTLANISEGDYTTITQIFPSVGVVTPEKFCRMLLLEQFAWAYEVDFSTGVGLTFDNVLIELLSMLLTFAFFPKMVQAGTASYGRRLMLIIQTINPVIYNRMVRLYGATVRLRADGTFDRISEICDPLTASDCHSGMMYSIFNPAVANEQRLPMWLRNISGLFNRPLADVVLVRKRIAGLPFSRDDFTAKSSWNINVTRQTEQQNNVLRGLVSEIVELTSDVLLTLQNSRAANRSMIATKRGIYSTFMQHVRMIAETSASLFFSMAFVTDTIQNSYLFVHEGYTARHPMLKPPFISMGPYFGSQQVDASRTFRPTVAIDVRVGLGILITVSGGVQRPILTTENLRGNWTFAEQNTKREVLPINGNEFAVRGLELARDSMRFCEAMTILQFMSDRVFHADPIFSFSVPFSQYLQMRTYAQIVQELSAIYMVDLLSILSDPRVGTNVGDFRTETLMMSLVNRYTDRPETVPATIFGRHIVWTDPISQDNIRMAAEVALSDYSPAVLSNTGLVIAMTDVNIVSPRTIPVAPLRRIPYTLQTLRYEDDDRSRGVVFILDGVQIITPTSDRLSGIRLVVNSFGDLAREHLEFISTSILFGRLSIEATNQQYSYDIKYILDNTTPIYASTEAEDLVLNTLKLMQGEYAHVIFPDSTYAVKINRFRSTIKTQRGYVFPLRPDVRTNEVITGIYDAANRPAEFMLNDGDQFGLGPNGGELTPITHIPKQNAEPNMNNIIPVYTTLTTFSGVPQIAVTPPGFT